MGLPPSHPYRGPHDLQRMVDFLMACRAAHPSGDYEHVGDLLWAFRRQPDPERNVRLWGDEPLAGFVMVTPLDGGLLCQAHPDAPDELPVALFDWGMARLAEAARGEGGAREIWVQAWEDNAARIQFLMRRGFSRGDYDVIELLRSLEGPIPAPMVPAGFTIRHLAGEEEVPAYVEMHRDAWSVWAPSTYSVEEHLRLMRQPGYERELTPIVVAPDGTLAAYCIGWLDPINRIGEIEPLGTRPGYARRGLARAIVYEVLRRMREHGMDTGLVYGTSRNEAAWRLYESTGFATGRTIYTYSRRLAR